ncbi:hypothetical protein ACVW1A_004553 [Bradyrhizobium sp. LB1.3]
MRSSLIIVAGLSAALIWSGEAALGSPPGDRGITAFGNAPIGHLQPHAPQFSPGSSADEAEQTSITSFNPSNRDWTENSIEVSISSVADLAGCRAKSSRCSGRSLRTIRLTWSSQAEVSFVNGNLLGPCRCHPTSGSKHPKSSDATESKKFVSPDNARVDRSVTELRVLSTNPRFGRDRRTSS